MKVLLLSLVVGMGVGWWLAAISNRTKANPPSNEAPVSDRISILGGNVASGEPIPQMKSTSFNGIDDFVMRLGSASFAEIKGWILNREPNAPPREVLEIILKHFMSMDPEAAFDFLTSEAVQPLSLRAAMKTWFQIDPMGAFETVMEKYPEGDLLYTFNEQADGDTLRKIYQALLDQGFDKEQPERFLSVVGNAVKHMNDDEAKNAYQALIERGFDESHPERFMRLLISFSEAIPETATKRAFDLAIEHARSDVLRSTEDVLVDVLDHWYEADAEAAFEWGLGKVDPDGKGDWGFEKLDGSADLPSMFTDWFIRATTKNQGMEGFERVWGSMNNDLQQRYIAGLEFPEDELDQVMDWIDANVTSPRQYGWGLMAQARAHSKAGRPEMMAEFVARLDKEYNEQGFENTVRLTSSEWARHDADGLRDWIATVENPAARAAALPELVNYWKDNNPGKLEEFTQQHPELFPDSRDPNEMPHEELQRVGVDELSAVLEGLSEEVRDESMRHYTATHVESSPEEILHFLDSQPKGFYRNQAIQTAISHFADRDPTQAADWVANLEEGQAKELAARNLANVWARSDPDAAEAWMQDLPPSPSRDRAIEQLANTIAFHEPERVLALAQSVTDQEVQDRLFRQSIQNLARRDPDRAAEEIQTKNLDSRWISLIQEERDLRNVFEE